MLITLNVFKIILLLWFSRFPNADNFVFKETNITCLGQLNAISEIQGLVSLTIDSEGNAITDKNWQSYAIYRLAHWGLKFINEKEVICLIL